MEHPDGLNAGEDDSSGPSTPKVALAGVPETALLTLYNRASEAERVDGLLSDPMAVDLVERLDYPFRERFGKPDLAHPLRAKQFDAEVRSFLDAHDGATIVALGAGLETQLWRAGAGCGRWVSVDVPEMSRVRQQLLPADPRSVIDPHSAWDLCWVTSIAPGLPTLITAQGLLMYFTETEVERLLRALVRACPGAVLVFDTIPTWAATAERGHRSANGYRLPAQPWGAGRRDLDRLLSRCGIEQYRLAPTPIGRGLFWAHVHPALTRVVPGVVPMTVVAQLPIPDRPL